MGFFENRRLQRRIAELEMQLSKQRKDKDLFESQCSNLNKKLKETYLGLEGDIQSDCELIDSIEGENAHKKYLQSLSKPVFAANLGMELLSDLNLPLIDKFPAYRTSLEILSECHSQRLNILTKQYVGVLKAIQDTEKEIERLNEMIT